MFLPSQEEWPEDPEAVAQIQADFDPQHPQLIGDRRQELVFIGQVRMRGCLGYG
jgi:hypothetical protein